MSNQITTMNAPAGYASAGTAATIFSPEGLNQLLKFAEVMAQSKVTVPAHLVGKTSDCLAVTMQAAQWGLNPFSVAQKTHLVNGQLGYEAQLVNAVVQNSGAIKGRFHYEYKGEGASLECRVGAIIRGEQDITWNEWLCISSVTTKNSPLWKTNPKQQIGYLQVKNWARAHTPGAILGVYTPDELAEAPRVERDVTPAATNAAGVNSLINGKAEKVIRPEEKVINTQAVKGETRSQDDILTAFTDAAGNAKSVEELDLIFNGGTWPDGKKRPGASDALSDRWLEMATDVYTIRRDEMKEVPM